MAQLDMLQVANEEFGKRLRAAEPDQWERPTPCEGWPVRRLVQHVVAGDRMAPMLFAGASKQEVIAMLAAARLGDDPVASWQQASAEERTAFARPGTLEMVIHHPIGDITGEQFLGFRIMDKVLHAWDVARAVKGDETLDQAAVGAAWAVLEPMSAFIGTVGQFGTGPSGSVAEDAPLQLRLLDLSGRRP